MMKKSLLKSAFAMAVVCAFLLAMPVAFAKESDNVIFSVMDENVTLESGALPLPVGFSAFVAEDNPGFIISAGNNERYAAINPDMAAISIVGKNSDTDGIVGIDFGRNISPEIFKSGSDKVFLSFYWCNVDKMGDLDKIELGSVYKAGDKLVRRDGVKLSKYYPVQANGFQKFEFSMKDLGITSDTDELWGLYFSVNTSRDGLWECVAKIDRLRFVNSVGEDDMSFIGDAEPVFLLKSNVHSKEKPVEVLETQNRKPLSTLMCRYSLSDNLGYTGYRVYEPYNTRGKAQMVFPVKTKNTVRSFFSLGIGSLENYSLKFDIARCDADRDISGLRVGAGFCIKGPTFSNSTTLLKYVNLSDYIDISRMPLEKTKRNTEGSYITVTIPLKDIMDTEEIVNINSSFADEITYENLSCIAFEFEAKGAKSINPVINLDNIRFELLGAPSIDKEYKEGIRWAASSADCLCCTVVKDGVRICDTTEPEIQNPEKGVYRIYTYLGNGLYSACDEINVD